MLSSSEELLSIVPELEKLGPYWSGRVWSPTLALAPGLRHFLRVCVWSSLLLLRRVLGFDGVCVGGGRG